MMAGAMFEGVPLGIGPKAKSDVRKSLFSLESNVLPGGSLHQNLITASLEEVARRWPSGCQAITSMNCRCAWSLFVVGGDSDSGFVVVQMRFVCGIRVLVSVDE